VLSFSLNTRNKHWQFSEEENASGSAQNSNLLTDDMKTYISFKLKLPHEHLHKFQAQTYQHSIGFRNSTKHSTERTSTTTEFTASSLTSIMSFWTNIDLPGGAQLPSFHGLGEQV
jgi:hypothetical protein